MPKSSQLALSLNTQQEASFSNFILGPNSQLVAHLNLLVTQAANLQEFNLIYLWGAAFSGKTHLLQAACNQASQLEISHLYLDLNKVSCLTSLTNLYHQPLPRLLALDNLTAWVANAEFEEAVFHLFNLAKQQNCLLLVSALANPANLGLTLPDLASRLAWGLTYQLQQLTDKEKLEVLVLEAKQRGIAITEEVKKHLLYHCPRDVKVLLSLLDKLDTASLEAQRRLTLPFVRSLIK